MDSIIIKSFLPEIFFSFSIMIQLLYNMEIIGSHRFNFPILDREYSIQSFFILVIFFILVLNIKTFGFISNFTFVLDESSKWVKLMVTFYALCILNALFFAFRMQKLNFIEFKSLLLFSLLSIYLMISSFDLLSFYLTVEFQSLCFYVLASSKKNSSFSIESGLKYFLTGSLVSAILLLGCSLLYLCLGTLKLSDLSLIFQFGLSSYANHFLIPIYFGVICITVSILFKIACAPLHFWAPDVYEGAPVFATLIFSLLPKIAIVYFLIKWVNCFGVDFLFFKKLLFYIGLFSVILGTAYSLRQLRLKRLIIYSSIAQVGFIVAAISLSNLGGFSSSFFFINIYILNSLLIWYFLVFFYLNQYLVSKQISFYSVTPVYITSLSNFFFFNKNWALSLFAILFSIGGIPPLTGFLSKIIILLEVTSFLKPFYAFFFLIISSLSVFYYIRLIKIFFFEPTQIKQKNYLYCSFNDYVYTNSYIFQSFLLFSLLAMFFYPNELILSCNYVLLSSLFF